MATCESRLAEERKAWRQSPLSGFNAKPVRTKDGMLDLKNWECGIPGLANTMWVGGLFKLTVAFPDEYPTVPPKCTFVPPLFHPNVDSEGTVSLSILEEEMWQSSATLKDILLGIQQLLSNPNTSSNVQADALKVFNQDPVEYEKQVRRMVSENPAP